MCWFRGLSDELEEESELVFIKDCGSLSNTQSQTIRDPTVRHMWSFYMKALHVLGPRHTENPWEICFAFKSALLKMQPTFMTNKGYLPSVAAVKHLLLSHYCGHQFLE